MDPQTEEIPRDSDGIAPRLSLRTCRPVRSHLPPRPVNDPQVVLEPQRQVALV